MNAIFNPMCKVWEVIPGGIGTDVGGTRCTEYYTIWEFLAQLF